MGQRVDYKKKMKHMKTNNMLTKEQIEKFKEKYDRIYINGCSHSAGGGFEMTMQEDKIKQRQGYKEKLGIEYSGTKDVAYGAHLADIFGIEVINEAKSGGGPNRLIRKVRQFMKTRDLLYLKRTLFILEIPSSNRLDLWSNEFMEHLVCNLDFDAGWDGRLKTFNLTQLHIVKEHFVKDVGLEMKYPLYQQILNDYIKYFHNPVVFEDKTEFELMSFFSLLKNMEIDFYIMPNGFGCTFDKKYGLDLYNKNVFKIIDNSEPNAFKYEHTYFYDLALWAGCKQKTIADEVGREWSYDGHPGLAAHKEWAQYISKYMVENL